MDNPLGYPSLLVAAFKHITIYRSPAFERYAPGLLGKDGVEEFVDFLAANPLAGAVIAGTGGMRKVRWSRPGMGKRGGIRVIYFYHDDEAPLGLFTIYGKSDKDDLSETEKAALRRIVVEIKRDLDARRLRARLRRGVSHV